MDHIVETASGSLKGSSDATVATYLGIPYGKPPTGDLRFRMATRAAAWTGIRDSTRWAKMCPQIWMPPEDPLAGDTGDSPFSEDCLTLNIWAPVPKPDRPLPVLFWIHGGGFQDGSPADVMYDGRSLAARGDVVVVSVAHRLNVFGYLYLGALAGDEYASSGNVGNLDIVLALEWVRDNIQQFGGNPNNVTLFGESGGAAKIGCLLGMPCAKGLFHRALMQSGARTLGPDRDEAEYFTTRYLTALDIPPSRWRRLLELPAGQLVDAYRALTGGHDVLFEPGPGPDGVTLPHAPLDAVSAGAAAEVSLMIGTCLDEMRAFWFAPQPLPAQFRQLNSLAAFQRRDLDGLGKLLGPTSEAIVSAYRTSHVLSDVEAGLGIVNDWKFRIPSIRFAEAQLNAAGSNVFMYIFSWHSCAEPEAGAAHALDIPFFFDNTNAVPVTRADPSSHELARRMSAALVAFAKTGNPACAELPLWPQYDSASRTTMFLDQECRTIDDPMAQQRLAWQGYPSSRLGW